MSIEARAGIQLFEQRKSGLAKAEGHAAKALVLAKAMAVDTPEDYTLAGERLLMAKSREELIDDVRKEIVVPIGRAHRYMSGEFKRSTDAWKKVWKELHSKRVAYDKRLVVDQKNREREVRELQRVQADKDRAAAEAEAATATERGEAALAQELRAEAKKPFVYIPVVPQVPPKTEGLQNRRTFKARVTDLDAVPMEFCKKVPDMATLHGLARTTANRFEGDVEKANKEAPAGVVFYEDTVPAKV